MQATARAEKKGGTEAGNDPFCTSSAPKPSWDIVGCPTPGKLPEDMRMRSKRNLLSIKGRLLCSLTQQGFPYSMTRMFVRAAVSWCRWCRFRANATGEQYEEDFEEDQSYCHYRVVHTK